MELPVLGICKVKFGAIRRGNRIGLAKVGSVSHVASQLLPQLGAAAVAVHG